jgi:hypothetical protein
MYSIGPSLPSACIDEHYTSIGCFSPSLVKRL